MPAIASVSQLENQVTSTGDDLVKLCSREEASPSNFLDVFPDELPLKIFSRVDGQELLATFTTSKRWCQLAQDEKVWKRILEREGLIFGVKEYKKYWRKPEVIPNISYLRAYRYFESPCPLVRVNPYDRVSPYNLPFVQDTPKKVKETQKLVLFSDEIIQNLEHVEELAKNPKPGGIPGCFDRRNSLSMAFEVHGKTPLGKSFWGFVQVTVLEQSRGRESIDFKKLQLAERYLPYYRIQRAVEASFFNMSQAVESGEYPYGQNPWTYTLCQEKIVSDEGYEVPLIVGAGNASDGLRVKTYSNSYYPELYGVALLREFKPVAQEGLK